MKVDCQWMDTNMEAFFVERLNSEEGRLAQSHVEECAQCREQVEQLRAVDPLVQRLFRQELALARTPGKRRSLVPAVGFATAMAALVLMFVLRAPQPVSNPPLLQPQASIISPVPTPEAPPVAKVNGAPVVDRAKPQPAATDQPNREVMKAQQTVPARNAPGFMVIDPAGYSRTLTDYRGYVLIFGFWSPEQPETVSNLEKVYEAFSSNTKLRILGVTSSQQPKPEGATFPTARNQGSTLLGASPSQILVVDGAGTVRMRGSLLEEPGELLNSIHAELNQLGINR